MSEVELSCLACVKMFLHVSVNQRCSVNGLLLATHTHTQPEPEPEPEPDPDPASEPEPGPTAQRLTVTDCVPLLHTHLPLTLSSQLALTQVDAWCSQTQQRIVGYYQANADVSDLSPTPGAFKMADQILKQCSAAVLLMIDGKKMSPGYRVPPIVMYENRDSHWTLKDKHTIMLGQWDDARFLVSQLLSSKDQTALVDFDAHLDDITQDWTNQKLNSKIMDLISPANGNM